MPTAATSSPRNAYFDFLKGLLITLVVWGHAIQFVGYSPPENWLNARFWSDPVFKFIYLFHMPLFIGLSGYLSFGAIQKRGLASTASGRFRQLIVPVVCWGLLWPSSLIFLGLIGPGPARPPPALPVLFSQIGIEVATRFWFLWAVFAGTILLAIARSLRVDRGAGLTVIACLLLLLPEMGAIPMIKYTVPFFFAGYLLRKHGADRIAAASWPRLGLLGVLGIGCYLAWTPAAYVYTNGLRLSATEVPRIVFIYLTGAIVSAGFLYLSYPLFRIWKPEWVMRFGRRSLDIYIIQTFVFLLLHGRSHPLQDSIYFSFLIAPILAIAVCSGCVLAGGVIERIPVLSSLLLGRPAVGMHRATKSTHSSGEPTNNAIASSFPPSEGEAGRS